MIRAAILGFLAAALVAALVAASRPPKPTGGVGTVTIEEYYDDAYYTAPKGAKSIRVIRREGGGGGK